MIARLRGEVLEASSGSLVVEAGGVGYEVHVPESVLAAVGIIGLSVDLYVRQVVREDDIALYGFINSEQRRLFDLLREVKGCGSKTSLAVIASLGEVETIAAIAAQDVRMLTKAPGVGPRLAERIVLELKNAVQDLALSHRVAVGGAVAKAAGPQDELVDALLALGYRRTEIDAVAPDIRAESTSVEEQLRLALKRLRR